MTTDLRENRLFIAGVAMVIFIIANESRSWVYGMESYAEAIQAMPLVLQRLEQPVRWFVLCLLGLWLVHRLPPWRIYDELGLWAPMQVGLVFGLIATLPMIVPSLIWGRLAADIDLLDLLFMAAVYPFAEASTIRNRPSLSMA